MNISEETKQALQEIEDQLMGDGFGLYQATKGLEEYLNNAEQLFKERKFDELSALGYGKISEYFVFLQRVISGIQHTSLQREKVIQEIALEHNLRFEEVESLLEDKSDELDSTP
jgi:hypothetical protein